MADEGVVEARPRDIGLAKRGVGGDLHSSARAGPLGAVEEREMHPAAVDPEVAEEASGSTGGEWPPPTTSTLGERSCGEPVAGEDLHVLGPGHLRVEARRPVEVVVARRKVYVAPRLAELAAKELPVSGLKRSCS